MYTINYFFETQSEKKNISAYYYIIKCFDDNETFCKVGITIQKNPSNRWYGIPYNIEIVQLQEMTLYNAWVKEQKFLKGLTKYKPSKKFHGHTECFISSNTKLTVL